MAAAGDLLVESGQECRLRHPPLLRPDRLGGRAQLGTEMIVVHLRAVQKALLVEGLCEPIGSGNPGRPGAPLDVLVLTLKQLLALAQPLLLGSLLKSIRTRPSLRLGVLDCRGRSTPRSGVVLAQLVLECGVQLRGCRSRRSTWQRT